MLLLLYSSGERLLWSKPDNSRISMFPPNFVSGFKSPLRDPNRPIQGCLQSASYEAVG